MYLKLWVTFNSRHRSVKKPLAHSLRALYRWVADLNMAVPGKEDPSRSTDGNDTSVGNSLASLFSTAAANTQTVTLSDVYKSLQKPTFHYFACDPLEYADSAFSHLFPEEVLTQILTSLDAYSLHQVSCSCKLLRNASVGVIPGLKLRLFEHQFTSGKLSC